MAEDRAQRTLDKLEEWLDRLHSCVAGSVTGNAREALTARTALARFYGMPGAWAESIRDFRGPIDDLTADLDRLLPEVTVFHGDLVDPIGEVEQAVGEMKAALLDFETERPASDLWDRELAKISVARSQAREGALSSFVCPICSRQFYLDDEASIEQFDAHIRMHHLRPADSERQLIDPTIHVERFDAAVARCKAAVAEAKTAVLSLIQEQGGKPVARGALKGTAVGRAEHTWKSAIRAKFVERLNEGQTARPNLKEAEWLVEWVRDEAKVPLLPNEEPIKARTVADDWIRRWREEFAEK